MASQKAKGHSRRVSIELPKGHRARSPPSPDQPSLSRSPPSPSPVSTLRPFGKSASLGRVTSSTAGSSSALMDRTRINKEEDALQRIADDPTGYLGTGGEDDDDDDEASSGDNGPLFERARSLGRSQSDSSVQYQGKGKAREKSSIRPTRSKREVGQQPAIIRRPNTAGLPHSSSNDIPSGIRSPSATSFPSFRDNAEHRPDSSAGKGVPDGSRPSRGLGSAVPLLRSLSTASFPAASTPSSANSSPIKKLAVPSSRQPSHHEVESGPSSLMSSSRGSPMSSPVPRGAEVGYGTMSRSVGAGRKRSRESAPLDIGSAHPERGSRNHNTLGTGERAPGQSLPSSRQNSTSSFVPSLSTSLLGDYENHYDPPLHTSTPFHRSRSGRSSRQHSGTPDAGSGSSIFRTIKKKVSVAGLSLRGVRRSGAGYDDDMRSPSARMAGGGCSPPGSASRVQSGGAGSHRPGHSRRESEVSGVTGTESHGDVDTLGEEDPELYTEPDEVEGHQYGGNYESGDEPEEDLDEIDLDAGIKTSGVRVWYSSWTSIDWLHDQIKDSVRVRRLRSAAKRSWRGWIRNAMDRSTAWVLVTIIGVLTAFIAFLVIRLETALFDLKMGFCQSSFGVTKHRCSNWMSWDRQYEVIFGRSATWSAPVAYFGSAMTFALISSIMTVYITVSTRFDGSKDVEHTKAAATTHATQHGLTVSKGATAIKLRVRKRLADKPLAYFAAGSGIPEIKTILGGFIIKGYLGASTLYVKSIGLALSVASGMSLGKEGPFVHIATAVANCVIRNFSKYETNEAKKREIYSAACAAGVSVAFGAPLGGTLFSWEEASMFYGAKVLWRSFFCAAVAALTLRALDPYHNGKLVLLELNFTRDHHSNSIYVMAVIMGVFGGLYGGIWNRLNLLWSRKVRNGTWLKRHPILEVAGVITITTMLSFPRHYTRMGGVEWVAYLFEECLPDSPNRFCGTGAQARLTAIQDISWTLLVRAGLAAITFGVKLPAGIFVPSLAAGAAAGRILGISLHSLDEAVPGLFAEGTIVPGVYALLGAAAALAGVTRTTVSLVVIVAELTSSLDYVVPIAVSVLIAKTVADSIEEDSIYELVINATGYPYLDPKKEPRIDSVGPMDVADTAVPQIRVDETHTVGSLRQKLEEIAEQGHPDGCFPCLRAFEGAADAANLEVFGLIAVNELQYALSKLDDDEARCTFSRSPYQMDLRDSSIWSDGPGAISDDAYNFEKYIDLAPLTVHPRAPMELVQQFFVKLGARCVVVVDGRGAYQGLILKKAYLKFLKDAEQR